jgi:SMI1-KNR4 cell-wall
MEVSLDMAISYMRENCDFDSIPETQWADADFRDFEVTTGLKIPSQLAQVLKQIGGGCAEQNNSFLVRYDNGSCSVHETQILISMKETMLGSQELFITNSSWPDRFNLPMIFFGSADGGNSYLLMDGSNPENNAVYFWERATDPWGTGDNTLGLGKVADSLYEFFYRLRPYEELTEQCKAEHYEEFLNFYDDEAFVELFIDLIPDLLPQSLDLIEDPQTPEKIVNGRRLAEQFEFRDPCDQVNFIVLMWKIAPNFFEFPPYKQIMEELSLSAAERLDRCDRVSFHELTQVYRAARGEK